MYIIFVKKNEKKILKKKFIFKNLFKICRPMPPLQIWRSRHVPSTPIGKSATVHSCAEGTQINNVAYFCDLEHLISNHIAFISLQLFLIPQIELIFTIMVPVRKCSFRSRKKSSHIYRIQPVQSRTTLHRCALLYSSFPPHLFYILVPSISSSMADRS